MTNTKHTKRALLASVLSLLLCISMLVGSTFAWFTDSATTGVGNIVAGTLDIDLVDANGDTLVGEGKSIGFVKADGSAITENILWEPGCSYLLEEVKLVNKGNLYAKCKLVITAINGATDGDVDLANVIDVYEGTERIGTLREILNRADAVKSDIVLAPAGKDGSEVAFGQLKLVMQTTAGNEYQGKSLTSITVTVLATQATAESDSFNDQYDAAAEYGSIQVNFGTEKVDGNYVPQVISNQTFSNNEAVVLGVNDGKVSNKMYGMNTTMNNVTIVDNAVFGTDIAPALHFGTLVFGTATLNDCKITGTTVNESDPYYTDRITDLGVFNYSKATINGGEYGVIDTWAQSSLTVNGAKVGTIYTSAASRITNHTGVTIGASSEVGLIDYNTTRYAPGVSNRFALTIQSGASVQKVDLTGVNLENSVISIANDATVSEIVVGEATYTVASFYEAYPTLAK